MKVHIIFYVSCVLRVWGRAFIVIHSLILCSCCFSCRGGGGHHDGIGATHYVDAASPFSFVLPLALHAIDVNFFIYNGKLSGLLRPNVFTTNATPSHQHP